MGKNHTGDDLDMNNSKTKKIVMCALFAAICFVITRFLQIPTFYTKGYVNIGDCAVLLAAYILGAKYGFISAAVGSALADVASGYMIYAPATFVIKGLVAVIAFAFYKMSFNKKHKLPFIVAGSVVSEIFMVAGYFLYELPLYGKAAVMSIPGNFIQAVTCFVLATVIILIFSKNKSLAHLADEMRK